MSKFLPKHPKIVKKLNNSLVQQTMSRLGMKLSKNSSVQHKQQIMMSYRNKQRQEVQKLRQKVRQSKDKNSIMQQALRYYSNQKQKQQLRQQIDKTRLDLQQTELKIKNCQKVKESTTPQQYYLWQKKKKMSDFNNRLNSITIQNQQQRQQLKQIVQKYKIKINATRQEIQLVLQQIQKVQGQFVPQSFDDLQGVDLQKIHSLKQEHQALMYTINMIRENNQILTSQLQESMENTQLSLRKSFQNTKSTLIRQIQLIKKQVQNSQDPQSHRSKGKQQTIKQCMLQYTQKLKQIQDLLSSQQARQAQRLIKPFDWLSFKWQSYLQNPQMQKSIDYMQKYQNIIKQYEQVQKQLQIAQKEIQDAVTQNVKMQQQNLQIQAAANKIIKLLPPKK